MMKWITRSGTWLVDGCFAGITLIALAACASLLLVLFLPLVLTLALWILALIATITLATSLKSTLHPELKELHWTGTVQRLHNKYLNWKAERTDEGEQHEYRDTEFVLEEEEDYLGEGDARTGELAACVLDGRRAMLEDRHGR